MNDPIGQQLPNASIDGARLFNEFQAQSRARMESTIKLVMILSGGMLTLSVGAVLGNSPSKIPPNLVSNLAWSWILLFYSIAAGVVLMAGMIAATFHMGVRMRKKMEGGNAGISFFATWSWLRILNACIGASALISFLAGVVLISQVAIGVAHSADGTGSASAAQHSQGSLNPIATQPPSAATEAGSVVQPQLQPSPTDTTQEIGAKAELDRKLVDFNGDLAHYTLALAILALFQFIALGAQAFFLRRAFQEAKRSANIAREAMIAGERAFVFALGVTQQSRI